MMTEVYDLEPKHVWKIFYDLTQIPRPSRKEEKAREYVINFAKEHGFTYKVDDYGNVYIKKPASPGYENVPPIIIQGHLDMVCAKDDPSFDCENDPITPYVDGEYVKAKGTSLGADNGIGVAMALGALIDEELKHGPLEVLLTVEEEIGLNGAKEINPEFLEGRHLMNVDSEEWGVITIGCAGGGNTTITLKTEKTSITPASNARVVLKVSGLKGGHSGVDIHEIRGNAIKILGTILYEITKKEKAFLEKFEGGSYTNVIPNEATLSIVFEKEQSLENAEKIINETIQKLNKIWEKPEPELKIEMIKEQLDSSINAIKPEDTKKIASLLQASHHGVIRYSPVIPGLVETSMNLAIIKTQEDAVVIKYSARSSLDEALEEAMLRIEALYSEFTDNIVHSDIYPGWDPDTDNEWFKIVKEAYASVLGKEPKAEAIHAGLETGAIKGKIPDMFLVAFGPNIYNAHTTNEKVEIKSVQNTYQVIKKIITSFAEKHK